MGLDDGVALQRSIRLATEADAYQLADIRYAWRGGEDRADGSEGMQAELDFLDRLALPHGDDYFCLVAELNGQVVGYLIAGGSRDLDRKAHGEVYEIAVRPTFRRNGIGRELLTEAIERFDAAAFAGTLLSAPADDLAVHSLTTGVNMHADRVPTATPPTIRYEHELGDSTRLRPKS